MKVTRAKAEENRIRILDVAARLFREHGVDRVAVSDVMAAAGLTHGGFYGNFRSKEDLVEQATARALIESSDQWRAVIETADGDPFEALVHFYVSALHRDVPGKGCALTALASDATRQGTGVRNVFTHGVDAYLDVLESVAPGKSKPARRKHALAALSSMVGAVVLARAVNDTSLGDEVLHATIAQLLNRHAE